MNEFTADQLRKFILERSSIRGEWTYLTDVWRELRAHADYPPTVKRVLGEALTAAVLLSATLKHDANLILQIRGTGAINLLVVQATAAGTVRGLAQWQGEVTEQPFASLFGNAQMAITIESKHNNERYQSLVALEGDSLAQSLENYFMRSEQLATRIWLNSTDHATAGLLLQRLPQEHTNDEDWARASALFDTLTNDELMSLSAEELVYRLFHEETPRMFAPQYLRFQCICSQQRIDDMLRSLGESEVQSILDEQGSIQVTCEFCNKHYVVDKIDASRLFKPSSPGSDTIH